MDRLRVPSFQEVLVRYQPLWSALYQAVDAALLEAAGKFREDLHTFDGGVHAGDVRLYTRDHLDRHGIESEEETTYEREDISNCGLSLRYKEARVKVFKSDNGDLPAARTKTRKRYYHQDGLMYVSLWSLLTPGEAGRDMRNEAFPALKLVAHWHITRPPSLRLINLMLALPNGADNPPFWNQPLPNPITAMAGVTRDADDQDDNIPGLRRLPFDPTGDWPSE